MIKAWTHGDDKTLRDMWGLSPVSEIAKELGRTSNSVRQRAVRLGLASKVLKNDLLHQRNKDKRSRPANQAEKVHMEWVAGLPCAVASNECCGRIEVHHVRKHASKRDHKRVIPLCVYHHRDSKAGYHGIGRENFNTRYGIDCCKTAERLWNETCSDVEDN